MNRDELKRAVAEKAITAGTNPGGKTAFSELVVEMVNPRHLTLDIFRLFMPVKELKPGDYLARRIRKGRFRARTMVPNVEHWATR